MAVNDNYYYVLVRCENATSTIMIFKLLIFSVAFYKIKVSMTKEVIVLATYSGRDSTSPSK